MQTILKYLTAPNIAVAFAAWCALITGLASVVSSLINVFTPYPKIETPLHKVYDRLAFLQHLDSSPTLLGILQWPIFQKSNPPGPIVLSSMSRGFARLAVLNFLCVLSLATLGACAWFQKTGGPAIIQCTEAQIAPTFGDVGNVLLQDSPEEKTQLEAIAAVRGEDALLCSIQKWVQSWTSSQAASLDPRVVIAAQHGQAYLKQSGKVVVVN